METISHNPILQLCIIFWTPQQTARSSWRWSGKLWLCVMFECVCVPVSSLCALLYSLHLSQVFILHWLLLSMSFSPIFVLITNGLWCVTELWGLVSGQWHASRHSPHSFTLIPLTTKLPQHSDIKLNGNKMSLSAARTESWPPCWASVLLEETRWPCHTDSTKPKHMSRKEIGGQRWMFKKLHNFFCFKSLWS